MSAAVADVLRAGACGGRPGWRSVVATISMLLAWCSALAPAARAQDTTNVECRLFDELAELYPDTRPTEGAEELELHSARGVPIGVHLLATGLDERAPVTLRVESDGRPMEHARWFRMIAVPVEENTGRTSRTEQYDGEQNPFVIRRAPFLIFEALQPISPPIVPGVTVLAVRLELPIGAEEPAGQRDYAIRLEQGDSQIDVKLVVTVHGVVVPPIGRDTLRYTNWFNPHDIAARHGAEPWSEEFWTMLGCYARLMARGRQNVFWVRWRDMFERVEDGPPRLRRERLERYVRTFEAAGLYWIEGAPIAHRPGGDWSSKMLQLGIVDLPATSPQGEAALTDMGRQLREAIRENGWEGRWIQHLADEPTDTNAEDYARLAELVREHLPGTPILEATMSRRLTGAVDIWCPQVQEFEAHRAFFDERRGAGDRVWVYTCLVPGGRWMNRLLDQERLRQTWLGWALVKHDLDGFLHWGLNHYKADPFAQSVVDHPAQPGTKNKLPAGDTHVIYPGDDGPWSGHRFEAHRIGLEDGELLRLLEARNPERAAEILDSVVRSFEDYEKDVARYRAAKRALLEALGSR